MMTQLSLLEIKPLVTPEKVESRQKEIQGLKRAYSRQKEIALTGNGREAYNAAILANHLKMEIGRLEKEGIR